MSVDQATESAIRVANNITLLMSDDQTKQGFMDMWYWLKHGSNIAVVGPNMQAIFENTSLANIRMDDISMPFNTIYIALQGFDGYTYDAGSGYHCIRGVSISVVDQSLFEVTSFIALQYGVSQNLKKGKVMMTFSYTQVFLT